MTIAITNREFHELVRDTVPECTELDAGYFFADPLDEEEPYGKSERTLALGACARCFIKNECFAYAINNNIAEGVWGGSVPQQRIAYWRKMELN